MRVTVTGATGLIGSSLLSALHEREAHVTVLTRDPDRARAALGDVDAVSWQPTRAPAPERALAGREAVVHLAGEPVAQRWSAQARRAIRDTRVLGTRNLVEGIAAAAPRPRLLVSSSATGYYGTHGEEPLDEEAGPGGDFLARVCVEWEAAAGVAAQLGTRVTHVRTGVVLACPRKGDRAGGALAKMLPAFRLGLGGPVAGGQQYISWIHARDVVGIILSTLEDERWRGPVNATAPEPVTNREFSTTLGRVLGRPARTPVPALALRALYGAMAEMAIGGARVLPAKALVLGYQFAYPHLEPALRAALSARP